MDFEEALEVLQVNIDSPQPIIKKAYRRMSMRYHPDKHPEDRYDWAVEKFRRIREAYQILSRELQELPAVSKEELEALRTLQLSREGAFQESILLELHPHYCLDLGAWSKEPPFFSRVHLKLAHRTRRFGFAVFKTRDFENSQQLKGSIALGRIEAQDPPAALTVLTKVNKLGRISISLLGDNRYLESQWSPP